MTNIELEKPKLIKDLGSDKYRNPIALYRCVCSNIFEARVYDVERGHTNSCGCYKISLAKLLSSK